MVDKDTLHSRITIAFQYLMNNGVIHSVQQFADALGKGYPQVHRALNNKGKDLTMGFLKCVAKSFPDTLNEEFLLNGIGNVAKPVGKPHIPFEVAAGGVAVALGSATLSDCEIRPTLPTFGDYDFTIEVSGKSMQPYILHGDTLICKNVGLNTVIIRPKHCYVIDTPEGAVVKHISIEGDFIVCKSINSDFQPFKLPIHDDMRFAMVVGIIRHCD